MKQLFYIVVGFLAIAGPATTQAANLHRASDWVGRPPLRIHQQATTSPTGYSPQQIRHAYGFDQLTNTGAGQVIGIVDAYDNPNAAADLQIFIQKFNLKNINGLPGSSACTVTAGPHPCFQKAYAESTRPRSDSGWALESSLDVQWAHAIAPASDILLVEASSNNLGSLLAAVDKTVTLGAQTVSMSWGGGEFPSESSYDSHFNHSGVTFIASSGDNGSGVLYPASSPRVLAVGGTSLNLDSNGNRNKTETAWSGSGGGVSLYENQPTFQTSFASFGNGKRTVPDVAYSADSHYGFSVYDSTPINGKKGWYQVGGTSAGAPQWAALTSLANQNRSSALSDPAVEYLAATSSYSSSFWDIATGNNGSCGTLCNAKTGYDTITGLGSPKAPSLISFLQSH